MNREGTAPVRAAGFVSSAWGVRAKGLPLDISLVKRGEKGPLPTVA